MRSLGGIAPGREEDMFQNSDYAAAQAVLDRLEAEVRAIAAILDRSQGATT